MMLGAKQLQSIRESTATVNVWEGSIRSGKTVASLLRFTLRCSKPVLSGETIIVGRTRDSAWRNVIGPLQSPAVVGTDVTNQIVGNYGAPTVNIFGRRVYVMGASDVKAELVLRGLTVEVAYVDEITTIPELFFVQLLGRMSVEGAQLFGTTNPDSPAHWLKKGYLDRLIDLPHWRRWHFTMVDNPGLTPEYVTQKAAEFTGLWYRRFIKGEWVQAEGAIYEAWDETLHVTDALPDHLTQLGVGVDYGTTNPARGVALAVGSLPGEPVRLYLTAEWDPPKGTEAQRSTSLRAWLANNPATPWVIVDPAAAGFKQQLFTDGVTNVISASNAVLPGIRLMSSLLAADRLRVHHSCTALLKEIPGYMWDPKATLRGEDAPIKLDDHSMDAARYVIYSTRHTWRRSIPIIAASQLAPGTDEEGVAA
jgi:phage terminase large subunit